MKSIFTHRTEGNCKLIVVFAGWGTDAELYRHLYRKGWDVLICFDPDGRPVDPSLFEGYDSVVLYAWSLGVLAAESYLPDVRLAAAYAINGTPSPCDDRRGIPKAIYRGTTDTLSELTLRKFRRRMFMSNEEYNALLPLLPAEPDIEDLQRQLRDAAIPLAYTQIPWRRAYISTEDRIFPSEAQKCAWQDIPVTLLEGHGHYVDLQRIVDITIPDTRAIAEGFAGSIDTYDKAADPQRTVALLLNDMLAQQEVHTGGCILEVGHASGLFSRLFAPLLQPECIDYIDLFPTEPLHLAPMERNIEGDAEDWIKRQPAEHYDYILSSSALQWFVDHDRFLGNCARVLAPGGLVACSLFIDGNMAELDAQRAAPISYLTEGTLRSIVERHLSVVRWQVMEVKEEFDSRMGMLRHIKQTGVTPVTASSTRTRKAIVSEQKSEHYTLTYRAVCFIAKA